MIEVTQRNTMHSNDYSHIESFNGMEVVSDHRKYARFSTAKKVQHSFSKMSYINSDTAEIVQYRGCWGNWHQIYFKFKLEDQEKLIQKFFMKRHANVT